MSSVSQRDTQKTGHCRAPTCYPAAGETRVTFVFFPFLFFTRPWRLLDLVPELLLLTASRDWVFFLPRTFFRLPTERVLRVWASVCVAALRRAQPGDYHAQAQGLQWKNKLQIKNPAAH